MKKMKKVIAVLMAALTVGASGMAVSAEDLDYAVDDELGLYYANAYNADSYISISNKKATCQSVVEGKSSVTKIYVQQILQKKNSSGNWINHAIWYRTVYSTYLDFSNTSATLSSNTYRVHTIAEVYTGTSYETIIKNSYTASC